MNGIVLLISRVTQVLLARQVRMALRAQEDSREREVFLAPWLVFPSAPYNSVSQIQSLSQLGYCIIVLGYQIAVRLC